jgi:catechol 2,3-dioxygenase-like lactoylglutathione lyase family enzyme
MKRLHVSLNVDDLDASIHFYSTFFGAEPTVHKSDYAKWMLEDPRVNFTINQRGRNTGVDHLGIQVDTEVELSEVYTRVARADGPTVDEGETTCCYARSTKQWTTDPDGTPWETFLTHDDAAVYGDDRPLLESESATASRDAPGEAPCCGPAGTAP